MCIIFNEKLKKCDPLKIKKEPFSLWKKVIPFHAPGIFLYPLKTSGVIERDQWHEID